MDLQREKPPDATSDFGASLPRKTLADIGQNDTAWKEGYFRLLHRQFSILSHSLLSPIAHHVAITACSNCCEGLVPATATYSFIMPAFLLYPSHSSHLTIPQSNPHTLFFSERYNEERTKYCRCNGTVSHCGDCWLDLKAHILATAKQDQYRVLRSIRTAEGMLCIHCKICRDRRWTTRKRL